MTPLTIVRGVQGFTGQFRFLSNFFIEPDRTHVEGEYQRAKCAEAHYRKLFDGLSPADARKLGRSSRIPLRRDWDDVRDEIMWFYVDKKFRDHPDLADSLRRTGTAWLEEANTWGDRYWGTVNGKGVNMLGAILMGVRGSLPGSRT